MDKQLTIFGEEISVGEVLNNPKGKRKSRKSEFRDKNGYNRYFKCGECKHLVECKTFTRMYCKCKKIGITGSDISMSDVACYLFENRKEVENDY